MKDMKYVLIYILIGVITQLTGMYIYDRYFAPGKAA